MLLVSCKVSEGHIKLTLQETRGIHDCMNRPKVEFIAYFYIFDKYLKSKIIYNLGNKTV